MINPRTLAGGLLACLTSVAVLLMGPVGRAAAEEDYVRGDMSATLNFGAGDEFGLLQIVAGKAGWWVSCDVAGYWTTTPSTGHNFLHLVGGCRRGWAMNDGDLELWAEAGDCGTLTARPGNIDDPDETASFEVLMVPVGGDGSSGQNCGAPNTLCAAVDGEGEVCKAWNIGAPPGAPDPYYNPVAGCAPFSPLEPWVTAPTAVAVSGGWAWQSTAMLSIPDATDFRALDGSNVFPALVVATTGTATVSAAVEAPGSGTATATGGGGGSTRWHMLPYYTYDGTWKWFQKRTLTITGPTHAGGIGSVPLDWQYMGAGMMWTGTSGSAWMGGSNVPHAWTGRPTAAQLATSGSGGEYSGHHDPERCHTWFGSQVFTDATGKDAPGGPLVLRDAPAPPPPGPAGETEPPLIHVGPGGDCPVEADVCIDPDTNVPDDPPPPSVPDPEGSSCEFSITEPSTWGGQLICALVAVAEMIVDAILSVIEAIGGLVTALLDGLLALFVPDEFPDFSGIESPLPEGWLPSLPDIPTGACGPMTLPSLDMGDMVGQTDAVEYLNTCEAPWTTARIVTYYGLLAVVLIGAGSRALRIVMTGLGMNVDAPTGKDED